MLDQHWRPKSPPPAADPVRSSRGLPSGGDGRTVKSQHSLMRFIFKPQRFRFVAFDFNAGLQLSDLALEPGPPARPLAPALVDFLSPTLAGCLFASLLGETGGAGQDP